MKNLKFEHQSIFTFWGRVKFNFRDRYGKPNIFSENSSHCQVFPPNCQKMTLWHKKENHYPPRWICITHIWSPTLFPRRIIIFQGVLTKFKFSTKFPHLEKFTDLTLSILTAYCWYIINCKRFGHNKSWAHFFWCDCTPSTK